MKKGEKDGIVEDAVGYFKLTPFKSASIFCLSTIYGHHGGYRWTDGFLDIWVEADFQNAQKVHVYKAGRKNNRKPQVTDILIEAH